MGCKVLTNYVLHDTGFEHSMIWYGPRSTTFFPLSQIPEEKRLWDADVISAIRLGCAEGLYLPGLAAAYIHAVESLTKYAGNGLISRRSNWRRAGHYLSMVHRTFLGSNPRTCDPKRR